MTTENTTTINAPRKFEEHPYEFLLYINNHVICQRFFPIRDYNPDVINSYEIKELMDNIAGINNGSWGRMGIIPNHLKNKSINYIWDNYNPFYIKQEEGNKNIFDKVDNFQFEIRVNKVTVAKTQFSGNFFPPKVRYAVDIKEIIPSIIAEIRHYFSQKKYNKVENYPLIEDIYNN